MKKTIYLAGALFNAGERFHNLQLEQHLRSIGHDVILPQREALQFIIDGKPDLAAIAADCASYAMSHDCVYVGCVDGPDADSGTAVEYGMAIAKTGRAVVYRTDFRTDLPKEVGMNAMLTQRGTKLVYHPCLETELERMDLYYAELAQLISDAVESL